MNPGFQGVPAPWNREFRAFGKRRRPPFIGIDRAAAPASMAELGAYYERIRPGLYAAATAGLRFTRLAFSQQRVFRGALRAIHRAETAGD